MLTYSELCEIPTFEQRLEYLALNSIPGEMTFGPLRKINQQFYRSKMWKDLRRQVIGRDLGFDLGVPGYDIYGRVLVHHMNPLSPQDIYLKTELAIDPEFLITVSNDTHLGIHFGFKRNEPVLVERTKGDTKLW